ncbi:MAG: hypothetical protein LLG00_08045 [Planctomycetaceae bacterium]|nr:hypothetical protein [Planctomycetaceae bacterium]
MSTIIAVLASLAVSGCASSPWHAERDAATDVSVAAKPGTEPSSSTAVAPNQGDAERLQRVMTELRQIGALDPVAQDKLLEDLRRSDPAIWPLVIEQCRATMAYRQRAQRQNGLADGDIKRLPVEAAAAEGPPKQYPSTCLPTTDEPNPWWSKRPPTGAGQSPGGMTSQPPGGTSESAAPEMVTPPVVQAAYVAPVAPVGTGWRGQLMAAIAAMEAETPERAGTPDEVAQLARLRMLYAAAGRREDAARPIPGAPAATQQFVAKELDGLGAWLDVERTPDAARRSADVKPALAEALGKLAETAALTVRNPAFCTEVISFGCAKRFEKYEFAANQEVLLYAEVENFASEATAKGYHTSLRSSYEIVDGRGACVAERKFAVTEEYCQNLRRDYFIGYHLRIPKQIAPGKYTLRLSIEDLMCHKTGQATIEFSVKKSG